MTEHAIEAAIASALESPRGEDAIAGVKAIVRGELERMDPDVEIRETQYFNHTFAPDFVLSWGTGKNRSQRDLFMRSSILSSTLLDDFVALGNKASGEQTAPAVLALKRNEIPEVRETAKSEVGLSPDVLLMDIGAWDDIAVSDADPSPVRTLVERNLVRGGRGLIVDEVTSNLVTVSRPGADGLDVQEFSALVNDIFVPEAALRIQRAAQLLDLAFADQLDLLDTELGERAEAIGGSLTESEIRLLLPYLLTAEGVTDDQRFWRHLGEMISLAQIEDMTSSLANLDLSRLVVPNLYVWKATRSSVSLYATDDVLDDEPESTEPLAEPVANPVGSQFEAGSAASDTHPPTSLSEPDAVGIWQLRARMLSTVIGGLRVFVTADGRRLRPREGARPARWDQLSERLAEFNLRSVALDGLQRRLTVTAETDAGVYADVRAIRESIDDEFHVPEVTVTVGEEEPLRVSFIQGQVTGSQVSVGDLARASLLLLGHRQDLDRSLLDEVVPPSI